MIKHPDGRLVEDNVPEDMSLVFDTDKGLVDARGLRPRGNHQHPGVCPAPGPRIAGVRSAGGFSSVSSRRGHARLDGFEASLIRGRSDCLVPTVRGLRRYSGCASGSV